MIKLLLLIGVIYLLLYPLESEKYVNIYHNKKNKECCLVEKIIHDGVKYDYKVLKGEECHLDKIKANNTHNLLIVGQPGWPDNKQCRNKKQSNNSESILGSCRRFNFECKDFITKAECNKFHNMEWNSVPCNIPIN